MSLVQDFITIAIPFGEACETFDPADVDRKIGELGNPAHPEIAARLRAAGMVHFLSIHAIAPDPAGGKAHLLIEATVDGKADAALPRLVDAIGADLLPVLALTSGITSVDEVLPLLTKHSHRISPSPLRWFGHLSGLPFNGLPGLSVRAIARNRAIAEKARAIIEAERGASSALSPQQLFRRVADRLEADLAPMRGGRPEPLSFCDRAQAPWLDFARSGWNAAWILRGLAAATGFLFPLVIMPWLVIAAGLLIAGKGIGAAASGAIVPGLVLSAALIALLIWLLRRDEMANRPVDRTPSAASLAAMMARENAPGMAQNHMISVTRLRPAWIRRLSMPAAFTVVAIMARIGAMRPGFLASIGTIHAARWIVLPGTRQLVFCSNYDGSWESYLEDFITKAAKGTTGMWSNTEGAPAARMLFWQGAEDGDRMKRYARRSMQPTPFWFSAHPDLSCTAMRKHALIASGLVWRERVEQCPSAAEAWLDLFGTVPRPDYGLQYEEIQTLIFGGLRRHPHSKVIALNFGTSGAQDAASAGERARRWLAGLIREDMIGFGDRPAEDLVCNIAFSAAGLRLLGLERELALEGEGTAQGFAPAFALGMAHPSRQRALGDPASLDWNDDQTHAVLLLYARDEASAARFAQIVARAEAEDLKVVTSIATGITMFDLDAFRKAWDASDEELSAPGEAHAFVHARPDTTDAFASEPFGFVDGVSQPLVRGFPGGHGGPDPVHGVEPGEFILGYADNRGYFPPSPLIERAMPGHEFLPATPDSQPGPLPDFGRTRIRPRDFGRNGSYLVIRQLEQDVEGFRAQLDRMAEEVCRQRDVSNPHHANLHRTREWIAAKLLGRWRDGSALVDHPFSPAFRSGADAARRNGFLFRDTDPQGLRCPFGSHIRRSLPRDSLGQTDPDELSVINRHRLLRRGRPYLAKDGKTAQGTLFMCFNADLERQFEFVQQTWLASPVFHGLEAEPDPFALHHGGHEAQQRFTIHGRNAPLTLCPVQRYVTLRGGGYYFLPGRQALGFLAGSAL